jgi:hypothetical protein
MSVTYVGSTFRRPDDLGIPPELIMETDPF